MSYKQKKQVEAEEKKLDTTVKQHSNIRSKSLKIVMGGHSTKELDKKHHFAEDDSKIQIIKINKKRKLWHHQSP